MSGIFDFVEAYVSASIKQLPPNVQVYCTKSNLQLLLRIVVIISSVILFIPRLTPTLRQAFGLRDEREEEINARLEFLKKQREGGGASPRPAGVGVVGKDGQIRRINATGATKSATTTPKAKATRRKG
jgi:hypothetical protein